MCSDHYTRIHRGYKDIEILFGSLTRTGKYICENQTRIDNSIQQYEKHFISGQRRQMTRTKKHVDNIT